MKNKELRINVQRVLNCNPCNLKPSSILVTYFSVDKEKSVEFNVGGGGYVEV